MKHTSLLWIFGYGSLIWRPAFPYQQSHPAIITGWTRRFWQGSTDHRGVPEAPGRVVTLLPQKDGQCWGVVYQVAPQHAHDVLQALDHREKGGYERHRLTAYLPYATPPQSETIEDVLVYVANADNPNYLGEAPLQDIAKQILYAHGPSGANREYLTKLTQSLREMKAQDAHVFELYEALQQLDPKEKVETMPSTAPPDLTGLSVSSDLQLRFASWPADKDPLYLIRHEVFVQEQKVPAEIEIDEWDPPSSHVLAVSEQGEPVGCGRLLPNGKIGRMAVRKPWRDRGIGRLLLEALLQQARYLQLKEVQLSAQIHATGFYERFGFVPQGPVYEEAGIPHQKMSLSLLEKK
ncbi:MAG: GNAT family N-acetyltransferase [Myxococcales bacterium]|nr:GNAT family N-acetyltransferase [Myxococcales bacterium]MCB9643920.1 GNAT family N-acetyltransferase [Myxococcales bacterium]